MLSVSKQLLRCSDLGQATGVVDRVPALMLEALKDFAACQQTNKQTFLYVGGELPRACTLLSLEFRIAESSAGHQHYMV